VFKGAATVANSAAQAFFAAYDAHDVDRMLSLCSADAQLRHVPMGGFETGAVQIVGRKAWSDLFAFLPGARVIVKSIFADDSHVCAEVAIVDRSRSFRLPQAYVLAFDESYRITQLTVYWDNVTLGIQLAKVALVRLVDVILSGPKR